MVKLIIPVEPVSKRVGICADGPLLQRRVEQRDQIDNLIQCVVQFFKNLRSEQMLLVFTFALGFGAIIRDVALLQFGELFGVCVIGLGFDGQIIEFSVN